MKQAMRRVEERISELRRLSDRPKSETIQNLNRELIEAAKTGDLEKVRTTVRRGADVNAKVDNETPLCAACFSWHEDVAVWLVEDGADKEEKGRLGFVPIIAALHTKQRRLFRKLVEMGLDINKDHGEWKENVLLQAVKSKDAEMVRLAVSLGATGHAVDHKKQNGLMIASVEGDKKMAEALLPVSDPDAKDREGRTASKLAELNGHTEIAAMLKQAESQ